MKQIVLVVSLSIAALLTTNGEAATCDFNGSNGYCIDGLVAGSYPYFDTAVDVSWKQKQQKLTASYDGKVDDTSIFYKSSTDFVDITNTKFTFTANIQDSVASGSIEISGNIASLGITKTPVLMSAVLAGAYGQDGNLIGFNTTGITCLQAINDYIGGGGCTTNEVVYFSLTSAIDLTSGDTSVKGKVKTSGTGLTSVPVPAAVWLLGSGLLGLLGIARRRKTA